MEELYALQGAKVQLFFEIGNFFLGFFLYKLHLLLDSTQRVNFNVVTLYFDDFLAYVHFFL